MDCSLVRRLQVAMLEAWNGSGAGIAPNEPLVISEPTPDGGTAGYDRVGCGNGEGYSGLMRKKRTSLSRFQAG